LASRRWIKICCRVSSRGRRVCMPVILHPHRIAGGAMAAQSPSLPRLLICRMPSSSHADLRSATGATRRRADRVHKAILSGRRATVMQSSAHLSIDPVEAQEFDPFLRSPHGSAQSHAADPRRQLSAVRFWTVRRSSATADAHDRCLTLGGVEHPSRTRGARPRLDAGVHRSCVRIQDFSGRCSHCRHSRLVVECQQLSRLRSSPASASVHADRWQSSRL
jgi:hypothetical protein